jgi:hypothetical protein
MCLTVAIRTVAIRSVKPQLSLGSFPIKFDKEGSSSSFCSVLFTLYCSLCSAKIKGQEKAKEGHLL